MNLRSLLLAAVATAALSITPAQAAFHLFQDLVQQVGFASLNCGGSAGGGLFCFGHVTYSPPASVPRPA